MTLCCDFTLDPGFPPAPRCPWRTVAWVACVAVSSGWEPHNRKETEGLLFMLREIHIQNYAVIDNLRVEFRPGLNLLSGETGSGKSILVDALGLALGGRASPDIIRTGTERATVTAVFTLAPVSGEQGSPGAAGASLPIPSGQVTTGATTRGRAPWEAWLDKYGLAGADETEIILRREIQTSGKSRLLVNDQ